MRLRRGIMMPCAVIGGGVVALTTVENPSNGTRLVEVPGQETSTLTSQSFSSNLKVTSGTIILEVTGKPKKNISSPISTPTFKPITTQSFMAVTPLTWAEISSM